jgi:hypothetical protein
MELKSSKHGQMQLLVFLSCSKLPTSMLGAQGMAKSKLFCSWPHMEHPSNRNAFSLLFLVLRVRGQKQ